MANAKGGLDVAILKKAIDCLHIRDIYLRDAEIRVEETYFPKLHAGEELDVQLRWGPRKASEQLWTNNATQESERVFLVEIHTAVRFVSKADSGKPPADVKPKAEFSAAYIAEYKVSSAEPIPREALDQFAQHNAIYHVWPYWREWLQAICARTQMPSFTLPMYVIRSNMETDTAKAAQAAKSA